MATPAFSIGEIEPIRVKKLNALDTRLSDVETNGTGGAIVALDGGDASNSGTPAISIDGGGA